ncbi:MAG: hypothetical protein LBB94_09340 [Clostridiales bacterium]|jgi:predicted ribosomally synthesized peptide with SipW-like signal peptide|nr:hypothetical protein [Clostridiales bacterium]
MKKNRAIVLGAAVVFAISMIGGGSYAWFTARAEDPNLGGLDGANSKGVRGGIVAGSVDLKVALESYTALNDGTRITQLGEYPGLLYPEDSVVLPQEAIINGVKYPAGTVVDGSIAEVKSVIEYVVENTSQIDILAQLNLTGIDIDGVVSEKQGGLGGGNDPIQAVQLNVSKLLGWDKTMDYTGSDAALNGKINYKTGLVYTGGQEFFNDGPTWFYFADNPKAGRTMFVDHRKLEKFGFLQDNNIYNINAVATGYISNAFDTNTTYADGTPFYQTSPEDLTAGDNTGLGVHMTSTIDPTLGGADKACKVVTSDAFDSSTEMMYLYMPAGGKTAVKIELSLPNYTDDTDVLANGVNIKGNEFQYAVFSLSFDTNGDMDYDSNDKLVGFGVQANSAAITDFFSSDVYDDLKSDGTHPILP